MENEVSTLEHLIRLVGICQIPQESWTAADREALRAARSHIQQERTKSESGCTTRGHAVTSASGPGKDGSEDS